MTTVRSGSWLAASTLALVAAYDAALFDLDGTIYRGADPIAGAAEAIASARSAGMRVRFVTNNAARPPEEVAAQLTGLGVSCDPTDVLTSAQAGARLLRERVPAGSAVLVVGGQGLVDAVAAEGLVPVPTADDGPAAVIQGWAPEVGWVMLAEAAYALEAGLPWVATNTDLTLPTSRGTAPGNGSFVALLAGVCGRTPDLVAGKPAAPLLVQAARSVDAQRPLVVGDRLDTDIAGAVAAGMPSLLVLTGVTRPRDLLAASAQARPTYVASGLDGLTRAQPGASIVDGRWVAGQAWARVDAAGRLESSATAAGVVSDDALVACAAATWSASDSGLQWSLDDALGNLIDDLLDGGVSGAG